ncbi:MAG: hypothetical protein ACM3UU_00035 [Ignavibacteriales bacterium]
MGYDSIIEFDNTSGSKVELCTTPKVSGKRHEVDKKYGVESVTKTK